MSDNPDKKSLPPAEPDMFLEDVETSFAWRSIPLEGWLCIPLFWILAGVVFWQFFTRYALDNSAVWTEEVARQLLILLTFFGAAYAVRMRAHICIGYFAGKLPGRLRCHANALCLVLQLAFYGYLVVLATKVAEATQFQKLMAVDLSKSVVYYAVALALVLLTLRTAIDIWHLVEAARKGAAQRQRLPGNACGSGESGR